MLGCSFVSHYHIQLQYIICFVGSRRRAETPTPCGIELYYFPSNPGRLVEVLRALVGYRHDGKAFDARYEEAYHNSVLFQRFFRQACEKENAKDWSRE